MTPLNDPATLLALFNELTGRPAVDVITSAQKYVKLSLAQQEVVSEIAAVAPHALYPNVAYGSIPTMTTTDNAIWTFGTDTDGNPITPIGKVQLYRNLSDIPNRPLREGIDFLNETIGIRIPGNRTLSGSLYYRGIVIPQTIDDSGDNDPALMPPSANELTAIRAAKNFFETGNGRNLQMADRMERRWNKRWPHWCLVWKRQFTNGGALQLPMWLIAAGVHNADRNG
jgi:hypothetical protein